MRISDWSSDVCSSDLGGDADANYMFSIGYTGKQETLKGSGLERISMRFNLDYKLSPKFEISNNLSYGNTTLNYHEEGPDWGIHPLRSEENTSELQSLMRISYAVFCLKNKKNIER